MYALQPLESIPVQSASSKKNPSPQLPFRDDQTIIIVHSSIYNTLFRKIVVNKIVKLVVIVCDFRPLAALVSRDRWLDTHSVGVDLRRQKPSALLFYFMTVI